MINVDQIIENVKDFPTLPTIYSALLDVMANPRSTVNDVANIITQDQSSSAKLLKAVNSSVYALQVRVDTVSQAIFHLGFNEVKNLVITLSVIKMFSKTKSLASFNVIDFWKHSIAVGVVTRFLGKLIGIKKIENYFLSGIIHDIGKLFFLNNLPDEYAKVTQHVYEKDISIRKAESELLGISHTVVGDMLAEKWKLPNSIRNPIKYHTEGHINNKIDTQVACVHLANIIARTMELGNPGDYLIPQPNENIWPALNLPPKTFTGSMQSLKNAYEQSVSILLQN